MSVVLRGGARALLQRLRGTEATIETGGRRMRVRLSDSAGLPPKARAAVGAVRQALKVTPFTDSGEVLEHLERLRLRVEDALDSGASPQGTHQGIDLGSFTRPLLALVDAQPGDTWGDVFDAVEALVLAVDAAAEGRKRGTGPLSRPIGQGAPGKNARALLRDAEPQLALPPAPPPAPAVPAELPLSIAQLARSLADEHGLRLADAQRIVWMEAEKIRERSRT